MQPMTQLGEYQLVEKLGEGGMGAVYKALHTKLKRMVAVKILPKDRLWDENAVARFEREMGAVGALDHPNIVRAHDAREIEGARFLVMEYVDGPDLNALGRACDPLPVADACEIVRQAALGLEHAHQHGLVHRDVKCSNLMVTRDGVVKILDLGLARFQFDPTAGDDVTGTGQAMGTVDYMAPEQVSDSRSVDIRADIYSLGCTFYKLLSGQTPFGGPDQKSLMQRMMAHASQPVPPIRQFRADVPDKLAAVLMHMLAKHPSDRFATPAEVAEAVGPFAAASNLPALVARAQGQPVPEPAPTQSMLRTQEIPDSSSGFKRLMQQIVEEPAVPPSRAMDRNRASRMPLALIAGFLATAVLCVAGVLVLALKSTGTGEQRAIPPLSPQGRGTGVEGATEKTFLVQQWRADERQGTMLQLDGETQNMERLELLSLAGEVKLLVTPGEHKLIINRLGYEPFEHSFTVTQGKDVPIRPTWKELAALAKRDMAQPPPSAPAPQGEASAKPKESKAQAAVPQEKPKQAVPPTPEPKETPEALAARKRLEALDARYAEAMKSVEAFAAGWDFRGAAVELQKIRFEEKELQDRLPQRRDELKRMHDLKQKVIAKINDAKPPFKKSALGIKGMGGDVVQADEKGLACKLLNGKTETLAWSEIGAKAVPKLLQQATDPASPDDWLAAAMIGLTCDDVPLSEKCFDQARLLGANIDRHLTPLASAAFARANVLLDKRQFAQADAALASLETKYANIPWFATYKPSVQSARSAAKAGIHESEAEKLYAEAAELFAQKESFDLRPLVEKLKADYATTGPVTDATRKPSFADLEKAVINLGNVVSVRLDGKGHFRSIQAAIDTASPKSVIQIEDSGPYNEHLVFPRDKQELAVRCRKPSWAVITSSSAGGRSGVLVTVPQGTDVSLERLVLAHTSPMGATTRCVSVEIGGRLQVRSSLLFMQGAEGLHLDHARCHLESSLIIASAYARLSSLNVRDCLCLGGRVSVDDSSNLDARTCTISSTLQISTNPAVVTDSVLQVLNHRPNVGHRVEFCDVISLAGYGGGAPGELGRACFTADPRFRDPENLDFRLMPGSPCIGKASDGGDIGCRYTPEMIELCKQALELRRRGILKF